MSDESITHPTNKKATPLWDGSLIHNLFAGTACHTNAGMSLAGVQQQQHSKIALFIM
jgi:hypothetical protein